jgi:hypothetical protein
VTILVHNGSDQPIVGAKVSTTWNTSTTITTCITGSTGACTITKTGWSSSVLSVTLNVTKLTLSGYTYKPAANHDPDGSSNGTNIVVAKP